MSRKYELGKCEWRQGDEQEVCVCVGQGDRPGSVNGDRKVNRKWG